MILANLLREMLHRLPPHQRILKVLEYSLMDPIAELLDRALASGHAYRLVVVRWLPTRLSVHSQDVQVVPDFGHKSIEVPLVMGANRKVVRNSAEQLQFLDGDGVDFVDDVDGWDIGDLALDHVDEIIS